MAISRARPIWQFRGRVEDREMEAISAKFRDFCFFAIFHLFSHFFYQYMPIGNCGYICYGLFMCFVRVFLHGYGFLRRG